MPRWEDWSQYLRKVKYDAGRKSPVRVSLSGLFASYLKLFSLAYSIIYALINSSASSGICLKLRVVPDREHKFGHEITCALNQ